MIMKKNQIKIYGLAGCEKCENTARKLSSLSIPYEFIECSGYNDECHNLEMLTGAVDYPMIVIDNNIYYLALNYNSNSTNKVYENGYSGIDSLTIHELLGKVVDHYKKERN